MSFDDNSIATIRLFTEADASACRQLYREGLIGGQIAENDTGFDIDDIFGTYMSRPGNRFWVAETASGEVVGMIGVQNHDAGSGEIRRLRVQQDQQRKGIGSRLMDTAVRFCVENSYLKITLDTWVERESALKVFEKFGFRHSRSRQLGGKELMYFYLDIYAKDQHENKK